MSVVYMIMKVYTYQVILSERRVFGMKRIETIETRNLAESAQKGGCGECQTSCQSACKTSCGVANQPCEKEEK